MKNTALRDRVFEAADELRKQSMPDLTRELFMIFEKTGSRLEYERVYFLRRKFLAVYGLSVIEKKDPKDIEKLKEVLGEISKEETWALPAHCNTVKRPEISREIDLFNSETAGALSEIVRECEKELGAELCEKIKKEIARRVLTPFSETKAFGFENAKHNWNAVCCGSIGVALLYLGEELFGKEKRNALLKRIDSSLEAYVESFPEDGACLEGAGYFNYGMSFLSAYVRRFKDIEKADPVFLKNPKLKAVANFPNAAFFTDGTSVNFSDASENEKLHTGMLRELKTDLGAEYAMGSSVGADFDTDPCYRFLPLSDDLKYGGDVFSDRSDSEGRTAVLPTSEWLVTENADGCFFAIKGGNNDEPHNHNDVGSYIFKSRKDTIASELGAGEYTADYFGEKRYDILCNSSLGHSLPVIGSLGQKTGKDAKAKDFSTAEKDGTVSVTMDLTSCYENVESLKRKAVFDKKKGLLDICDEILSEEEVSDRIVSKMDISGRIELLSEGCFFEKKTDTFSNHEGIGEKIYIFEIKEKNDGNNKEGHNGERLHRFSYRLHSR